MRACLGLYVNSFWCWFNDEKTWLVAQMSTGVSSHISSTSKQLLILPLVLIIRNFLKGTTTICISSCACSLGGGCFVLGLLLDSGGRYRIDGAVLVLTCVLGGCPSNASDQLPVLWGVWDLVRWNLAQVLILAWHGILCDVLGEGYFVDFTHVADEESHHFSWCSQRLVELGFKCWDMLAHNLLYKR